MDFSFSALFLKRRKGTPVTLPLQALIYKQ